MKNFHADDMFLHVFVTIVSVPLCIRTVYKYILLVFILVSGQLYRCISTVKVFTVTDLTLERVMSLGFEVLFLQCLVKQLLNANAKRVSRLAAAFKVGAAPSCIYRWFDWLVLFLQYVMQRWKVYRQYIVFLKKVWSLPWLPSLSVSL